MEPPINDIECKNFVGRLDHTCKKTCDVAGKAILAKINLRKKCVNRDKNVDRDKSA